jgi:hypothetical protein
LKKDDINSFAHTHEKPFCGGGFAASHPSNPSYFYSETSNTDGHHWHYAADGKTPVVWVA